MNWSRFRINTDFVTTRVTTDLSVVTCGVINTIDFGVKSANANDGISTRRRASVFLLWLLDILADFATPVRAADLSVFAVVIINAIHSWSEDASSKGSFGLRTSFVNGSRVDWFVCSHSVFADLSTSVVTTELTDFAIVISRTINRWVKNTGSKFGWNYRTSSFSCWRNVRLGFCVGKGVHTDFIASIGTANLPACAFIVIHAVDSWVEDTSSEG